MIKAVFTNTNENRSSVAELNQLNQNILLSVTTFTLAFLLLLSHSWLSVFYPLLAVEDGMVLFAYYNTHSGFEYIFRAYNGYISFLPNLIGWSSQFLPAYIIPHYFAVTALLIGAVAHSLFVLKPFEHIIGSQAVRALICLIIAALPLANRVLLTSVMYSIWHLLLILMLLTLIKKPRHKLGKSALFIVMVTLTISTPVSIVCLPFWIYLAAKSRDNRYFFLGLIASYLLYFLIGVNQTSESELTFRTILISIHYIFQRVIPEIFFGPVIRLSLYESNPSINYVISSVVIIGWGYLQFRYKSTSPKLNPCFVLCIVLVIGALTLIAVYGRSFDFSTAMGRLGQRHFYIQQMLVAFLILSALIPVFVDRGPAIRLTLASSLLIIVAHSDSLFSTAPQKHYRQHHRLMEFLHTYENHSKSGDCTQRHTVFERSPEAGWKIRLKYRGC